MLKWLKDFSEKPKNVYLVHGEPQAMDTLRVKIKDVLGIDVSILKQDQMQFLFQINDQTNSQKSHDKNYNVNV